MAERSAPAVPWLTVLFVALAVIVAGIGGWEWRMRAWGVHADLGDGPSAWARERRKIDHGLGKVVIVGSSRLLFDVDLPRWQALTGTKPIQLARPGTTPVPIIHDLAVDPRFKGLMIVGYDPMVFFGPPGFARDMLESYHKEPLYKRAGLWIYERFTGMFAFLDGPFTPLNHILRWPVPQRTKMGPFNTPWRLAENGADRDTWMWSRVEHDKAFREQAEALWLIVRGPPPPPGPRAKLFDAIARDVVLVRRHGGDVIFVRSPSDPPLLPLENKLFPRGDTWDAMLARTHTRGIYAADVPALARFHTVEWSHLGRADRSPFTDALVATIGPAAKGR